MVVVCDDVDMDRCVMHRCVLNNNTDSTNNEIKESTGITVVILELIPGGDVLIVVVVGCVYDNNKDKQTTRTNNKNHIRIY